MTFYNHYLITETVNKDTWVLARSSKKLPLIVVTLEYTANLLCTLLYGDSIYSIILIAN